MSECMPTLFVLHAIFLERKLHLHLLKISPDLLLLLFIYYFFSLLEFIWNLSGFLLIVGTSQVHKIVSIAHHFFQDYKF